MYFSRDFKWDASSHQFKEWCDRSQGFFARMRGVTRATIATLESQLQASIDLARNLVCFFPFSTLLVSPPRPLLAHISMKWN